jgi:DNA invertase Pin-like site-specific DNA recombinase
MKVAIYCRVSTVDQSTDLQLNELREYCQRRGWDVAEVFTDEGVSGSKASRPALDRLMKAARQRKFDAVVVWKFDRFARSVSHLLRALEEFRALGIEFVSLTEAVDTSTPMGKMVFTVLGAVAELEKSLIVERVKAGMRAAKNRGTKLGRKAVTVNVAEIQKLRAEGLSFEAMASKTGLSVGTLHRASKRVA